MAINRNLSERRKRELRKRNTRLTEHQQALLVLQQVKENTGRVIHVPISDRTTMELPANLPIEEIKERVEAYKKNRKMKV